MTDIELVAALGWQSCERDSNDDIACVIHGVYLSPKDTHCVAMLNRLAGARAALRVMADELRPLLNTADEVYRDNAAMYRVLGLMRSTIDAYVGGAS